MRGKIAGTLIAVAAAVLGAIGLGYTLGSDRRGDELAFVEKQLAATRDEVARLSDEQRELLDHIEEYQPSEVGPAAEAADGEGQDGQATPGSLAAHLTRGVPAAIDDTGYVVEFASVRRSPGGGYAATVAVTYQGTREERELAAGETAIVHGVAVTVTSADAAKARLLLELP